MSIIKEEVFYCKNCGKASRHRYFLSWNSMVSGPHRIHGFDAFGPVLLMECPSCGYVAPNLFEMNKNLNKEDIEEVNKIFEEKYADLFDYESTRKYLKHYLLNSRDNNFNLAEAIFALGKAVNNEKEDPNNKVLIDELKQLILDNYDELQESLINFLDLLRECSEFDFVLEHLADCSDKIPEKLMQLEKEYCEDKNSGAIFIRELELLD